MIGTKIEFVSGPVNQNKEQGIVRDKIRLIFGAENLVFAQQSSVGLTNYDIYLVELDTSEVKLVMPSSVIKIIQK